ncbi:acyltransferase family protein, partial [Novosphingobium pentaromativorans]
MVAEQTSRSSRPREFATLDLLRFAAAQAVVFYHLLFLSWVETPAAGGIGAVAQSGARFEEAIPWASIGWVGVPIFFVISGFVIVMSAGDKTPGEFLIGRARRILPALWAFSLLSAAVVMIAGVLAPLEALGRLMRSMVLFPFGPWIDGAIWTLVAEVLFYVLIFAAMKFRLLSQMTALTSAITGFNLVFWIGIVLAASGAFGLDTKAVADLAASYRLSVTLVTTNCFFLVGMALYQVHAGKDVV